MLACASVTFLGQVALAEEMKFNYSLGPMQNICFIENIAENIQGKIEKILIQEMPIFSLMKHVCLTSK